MIEIALKNIEKSYGSFKILNNVSFFINRFERIGLIGRNGTGKTTLFKIIKEIETKDSGDLFIRKGSSVGYLHQIPDFPSEYRIEDILRSAFKNLYLLKEKIEKIEILLSDKKENENSNLIKLYGRLQSEFEIFGGYEIENRIEVVSTGLKIHNAFRERLFNTLSGGEKTRVSLAKILLENPDILLLDEPTNHLDMSSIEWLEDFLSNYRGSVLLISHDRYLLDRIVDKIIEIDFGEADVYKGNYTFYLKEKEKKLMSQFHAFNDQQKKIKAMKEAIERFRVWGGSGGGNPKMFIKARNMEKRLQKIEKIDKPLLERKKIKLKLKSTERSGKDVIISEKLSKSFDDESVLENINLHLRLGEKVCILGKNGTGKTTLMNILHGDLSPDSGNLKIGSNVKIGYLQQEVIFENENYDVLTTFRMSCSYDEGSSRNKLAGFLFFGDEVFKSVKDISGGEKSKLKLCMLMNEDNNVLLLDEPTNHLDIESREVLEDALENFKATVLFISHDRYFINKIAGKILELENKSIVEYSGNYEYFKRKKDNKSFHYEREEVRSERNPIKKLKTTSNFEKKLKIQINEIESDISALENEISENEKEIQCLHDDHIKINELYNKNKEMRNKIDVLIDQWEKLHKKLNN